MPPPDDKPRQDWLTPEDDSYARAQLEAIRGLAEKLGRVVEEVREDTTKQLARYREDIHRAILGVQRRLVELEERMEGDAKARGARQQILDKALAGLRTHQYVRLVVEIVIVVAIIAYLAGGR